MYGFFVRETGHPLNVFNARTCIPKVAKRGRAIGFRELAAFIVEDQPVMNQSRRWEFKQHLEKPVETRGRCKILPSHNMSDVLEDIIYDD